MADGVKRKIEDLFGLVEPRVLNSEAKPRIKEYLNLVGPTLKACGFRKMKSKWLKTHPDLDVMFHIRKDEYSNRLFLDYAFWFPKFGAYEAMVSTWWHIHGRFKTEVDPDYLDFDNKIPVQEKAEALIGFIKENEYRFFSLDGDVACLRKFALDAGAHCEQSEIRDYLGLRD